MKGTIDKYIKRLNTSLGRSALLNVAPGKNTTSRFDLARFDILDRPAAEILAEILYGPSREVVLDLKLLEPDSRNDRKVREWLYKIARFSLEKKASFISRESGFRSLWILYPIVYIKTHLLIPRRCVPS